MKFDKVLELADCSISEDLRWRMLCPPNFVAALGTMRSPRSADRREIIMMTIEFLWRTDHASEIITGIRTYWFADEHPAANAYARSPLPFFTDTLDECACVCVCVCVRVR